MTKVLGLDLGANSIGWAYIDSNSNKLLREGAEVYSLNQERQRQRALRRISIRRKNRIGVAKLYFRSVKYSPIIVGLIILSSLTLLLSFLNNQNWQFWLNISLTSVLTTLTLIHQDKGNKD